jgi:hypothetical protein
MLLGMYGHEITPVQLLKDVPVSADDQGEEHGTTAQELATWCLHHNFTVVMHTFDFQITDVTWEGYDRRKLLARLEAVLENRDVPSLGKALSRVYVKSYIDFLKAGGELHVLPQVTTKLLYDLLQNGPIFVNVAAAVLFRHGRQRFTGLLKGVPDDVAGTIGTHSMVLFGNTEEGDFLAADPGDAGEFKLISLEPEELIVSMTAAQIECDNFIFQIFPKTE